MFGNIILSGIGQSTYTVKLLGNLYLVGHVHATSLHVEGGKPIHACGTGWAVRKCLTDYPELNMSYLDDSQDIEFIFHTN